MRALLSAVAFGVGFGLVALPAQAAVLPVTGTVSVSFWHFPEPMLTGSGTGSSRAGGIAEHPALFATASLLPIAPTFLALAALSIPAGGSLPAGSGAGMNGLAAELRFVPRSSAMPSTFPPVTVPLTPIGGGGSQFFGLGIIGGTFHGATWQAAVGTATPAVFDMRRGALAIPITVTATAYDNRTAGGVGTVQFVAPATGWIEPFGSFPIFSTLTLTYTPEPGTSLLLGAGLVALGIGTRKSRR